MAVYAPFPGLPLLSAETPRQDLPRLENLP